jgi:hypothetical protein
MVGDESPPVEGLEWMGTYPPAPRACIPIRVGQVWSFANRIGRLYEIIGFLGESQLCYVTWRSLINLEDPICIGTQVHIDEPNFCNGAGGGSSMNISTFLHGLGGEASLVFLSEEKHKSSGVTCCRVLGSRTRHPSHGTAPIVSHLWSRLIEMSGPASQIYTDGSRASHADVGDFYAGVNTSKSSSGVAFYIPDGDQFTGIHIVGQPAMSNSYMTEMLALSLGARLAEARNLVVHSDCAAALGSLRRRQSKKVKTSPYWQLDMLMLPRKFCKF